MYNLVFIVQVTFLKNLFCIYFRLKHFKLKHQNIPFTQKMWNLLQMYNI